MSSVGQLSPPQKAVSHLLEDDPDLRDIVEEFVAALPERVEELRRAYEALDWDQLTMLAHRLKGASGSYGYPDLSAVAANMEQSFRGQQADGFAEWARYIEAYAAAARAGLTGN